MKKFFAAILLSLVLCPLSLLTGCGENSSDDKNYLKVMLDTPILSLDTNKATDGTSFEVIAACIDGLLQQSPDGKSIPAIAESYDVSADGKTYTFHLRDAKWSNGDPVTADDFVFAWRRSCTNVWTYTYLFSDICRVKNADAVIKGADPKILGVSAPDEKTFVVELEEPVPYFISLMSFTPFYPINEKFFNGLEAGTYGTSPETFLSNGAFVLEEYQPGATNLKLKKNDGYWDAQKIKLAGISYQVVGSSEVALNAFKNGSLDVVQIGGNQYVHVKDDESLAKNLAAQVADYMWFLAFNCTNENLANANLRLALANAVDRESLAENYLLDGSIPTYTAVPEGVAFNDNGEDFSADQKKFSQYISSNVDQAQKYFAAAKAELGKDNFAFTLTFGNDEGEDVTKVAQAIKSQIEEALPGVVINLQPTMKAERIEKMNHQNFDIALDRWGADYADPTTYLTMWMTNNPNNAGKWSNAEYDKIISDCMSGFYFGKPSARWQAMHDAEELVIREAAIAPLYTKAKTNLISDNVKGIEFYATCIPLVCKFATIE